MHRFSKVGLQNRFFLKKLGSWEQIFAKISVFGVENNPKLHEFFYEDDIQLQIQSATPTPGKKEENTQIEGKIILLILLCRYE